MWYRVETWSQCYKGWTLSNCDWILVPLQGRGLPNTHWLQTETLSSNWGRKSLTSALRESREVHFPAGRASECLNRVVPAANVKSLTALVLHRGAGDPVALVKTSLSSNELEEASAESPGVVNCSAQGDLFLQIGAGTVPTEWWFLGEVTKSWSAPSIEGVDGKTIWHPACEGIVVRIVSLGLVPAVGRIETSHTMANVHKCRPDQFASWVWTWLRGDRVPISDQTGVGWIPCLLKVFFTASTFISDFRISKN